MLALSIPVFAQLNQNCTVSVLNRNVQVNADGSWVLPNIPANSGQVKARATCVQNGLTTSGESAFFTVPVNGAVNLPDIVIGSASQIPVSLTLTPAPVSLASIGQTTQLTVTAIYPDNTTKNVSAASTGTNYTTSNPAIISISPNGLLTAVASGTVVIQAINDGASGIITARVTLASADTDGDGIPDSAEIQLGMDPRNPVDAQEDFDRDGLINLREYQLGTDIRKADTDGDGLNDGDEVARGTNPLLADSDGDLIPDGVEVTTNTNPLDRNQYNLRLAAATSILTPPSFSLATSVINSNVSAQLTWTVTLIDGKTTLNLTADTRTTFTSSNLNICSFDATKGKVFAGATGGCLITATNNNLSATASGTVTSFAPSEISAIDIPGAVAVDVAGRYAYVATGPNGLTVVDVADRANPVVRATVGNLGNIVAVRASGEWLLLLDSGGFLRTVNVQNPASPQVLAARLAIQGTPNYLSLRDGIAAISAGSGGVSFVNASLPFAPVLLARVATAAPAVGVDTDLARGLAAVALGTGGLQIFDIANPSSPQPKGMLPGGNVQRVLLRYPSVLLADTQRSVTAVNITNPAAPMISSSIRPDLGGAPVDIAASGNVAITADVSFGRVVPIISLADPLQPQTLAFWTIGTPGFSSSIAMDNSFGYLISAGRLRIGKYQDITDTLGVAPTVSVTQPASGTILIQGQTLSLVATANDDVAVSSVTFLVNGLPVANVASPPYQTSISVGNVSTITIGATALDFGNNVGTAANVTLQVIPDPLTTATGRVIDQGGNPVSNATIGAFGRSTTTASNGTFSLTGLPTIRGPIVVTAVATMGGTLLGGVSAAIAPVRGGTIQAGDIRIGPKPFITSITPTAVLAGTTATLTVTGANLGGSIFAFDQSGATISAPSINAAGTSATVTVAFLAATSGRMTLLATNPAGVSDSTPIVGFIIGAPGFNTISVTGPGANDDPDKDGATNAQEITAGTDPLNGDTDGDTWPDGLEIALGSSPRNPGSIPNPASSSGYVSSLTLSILNNRNPGTGTANSTQYVSGLTFSLLNSLNPSTAVAGTTQYVSSLTLSILNSRNPGLGALNSTQYVSGLTFSILNSLNPSSGLAGSNQYVSSLTFSMLNNRNPGLGVLNSTQYVSGLTFSILNNLNPSIGLAGSNQYVSSLTFSMLNVRSPAPVGPTAKFVNGSVFSIANGLNLVSTSLSPTSLFNRLIVDRLANPSMFEEAGQKRVDSDGDGVADEDEIRLRTNPLNSDTDHDGYPDGLEIVLGSDPLDAASRPNINRPGFVVSPALSIQNYAPQARQRAPGQPVAFRRRP